LKNSDVPNHELSKSQRSTGFYLDSHVFLKPLKRWRGVRKTQLPNHDFSQRLNPLEQISARAAIPRAFIDHQLQSLFLLRNVKGL
jgi:hypothetical protein